MRFDSTAYGSAVAGILSLDGKGHRLMPLARGACSSPEASALLEEASAGQLFPDARAPEAALSGLWLYFSCLEKSHGLSQDIPSAEGSFWHAIMHRQEPDAGNSAYWFRRVGKHPIFDALNQEAAELASSSPEAGFRLKDHWDPFGFIDFCEAARVRPGSARERLAMQIQRCEWQLLFDYCARPR